MEAFVGRAAELRLFEAALAGARSGSGRLITVSGPAGVAGPAVRTTIAGGHPSRTPARVARPPRAVRAG